MTRMQTKKKKKGRDESRYTVDVRDQECSKPVVTITNKLERLDPGETLEVLANDSAYEDVIRIFGKIQNLPLREENEKDFVRVFITKK